MKIWLGVSVLLSASVAFAYTSPVQTSQRLEGTTTVGQVVDVYNKGSWENAAFRLLEVESGHGEEGALPLKFKIKETLCLKTEKQNLQKCDFKEDGLVKACSASLLKEQDPPALVVICDSVTIPSFRSKRSRNVRGKSNGNGRKTEKRKCQRSARCENPIHPGMFAVFSKVEEDTPVLQTKEFQNKKKGSNGNKRQPIGKKCTGGINCKKGPPRLKPGAFATIERYEPSSADKKPSLNTNGSSNGYRREPTKPKCRAGGLCDRKPLPPTYANQMKPSVHSRKPLALGFKTQFQICPPPRHLDLMPLRPKRSPNTNGGSNENRKKPTKPKCSAGKKCEKKPLNVNPGHWSSIAKLPTDSVFA